MHQTMCKTVLTTRFKKHHDLADVVQCGGAAFLKYNLTDIDYNF